MNQVFNPERQRGRRLLWAAVLLFVQPATAAWAQGEGGCGALTNGYGPFDYRKDKDKLPIVEGNHFTPAVEALIRGISGPIGGELDYTLRAFPNHHRALIAMIGLAEKTKNIQPSGAHYTVDCYFDRAVRLAPDDNVVRLIYARYLGKKGRLDDAMLQIEASARQAGDNGLSHFNIGLVCIELSKFDMALEHAHKALALGYDRPELRQQLEKAGKWREPTP